MADTASLIARVKTEGVAAADKQLDDFASSAAKAETQTEKFTAGAGKANIATRQAANDGFAKFRNAAGQVGFQVQDMVVQLQSGTSAFVAIGQQGSQLAGAFGPGGAVLGAVIALASAVGGVLYKSLGDAEIGTKELAEAQKNLQIVLQQSENGAYKAADAFARLIRQGASAAVINAKVASAQQASNTELKSFQQIAGEASKAGDTLWDGNAIGAASSLKTGAAVSSLNGYLDSFSKKMGISREEAKQLVPLLADVQRSADAKTIAALADQTDKLSKKYNNQNAEMVKLNGSLQAGVQASADNAAQQKALATIVEDTNKKQAASNDLYLRSLEVRGARGKEQAALERDLLKAQIKEKEGLTDAERQRANSAADKEYEAEIKKIEEQEKKKKDHEDKAEKNRQESAAKREAARLAAQQKAADSFLNLIERSSVDRLKVIDATEKQRLEQAKIYAEQGSITQKQYEDAKTKIALEAEDARQKELAERQKKQDDANIKLETFIANLDIQNASELESIDIQQAEKLKRLDEYYANAKGMEDDYQKAREAIAVKFDKQRVTAYQSMLGDTTDNLKSALGEGNKMYKAFAIANAVMNTYQAANAAYQSASAIPIVGWVLGPIAAAAAVAAGLANVQKIRSAREQGGNLAAGQISTIAERKKPEVIMPAGASRVRTAEQMRQIMGESSSRNGVTGVTIVNNTSSQISSARTEQDDEGRLRVIISEQVSMELQDSNSPISRSRRATRNQPGIA